MDLRDVELVVARDREGRPLDLALHYPQTLLVVGKRRVEKVHVRAHGLPHQRLVGPALLLGPLDELLRERPIALCLVTDLAHHHPV